MKRTLLVLTFPLLLAGCAQVFDGNLFQSIDKPTPLDASALAKASPDEIRNRMKDDSFVNQLKDDQTLLTAAQQALITSFTDSSTPAADVLADATTLIELTSSASSISDMKAQATTNITSISDAVSAGNYALALKIFMGNQTEAEIKVTLGNLMVVAGTLEFMMAKAIKPVNLVDSTLFFSATTDKGSFAQSALMAAIAYAMMADLGGHNASTGLPLLAADLASATPSSGSNGTDMTVFKAAKDADPASYTTLAGTAAPSNYCYTYVATLIPELAFGL